jgi:N-dimethylarginine dimethylaminohydrolase
MAWQQRAPTVSRPAPVRRPERRIVEETYEKYGIPAKPIV